MKKINIEKEGKGLVKDFSAFVNRGNVLDLAIGVVMAAAFSPVVSGLVSYIINPVVSIFTRGIDLNSIKTVLIEADEATEQAEVAILWGSWLQTILVFAITAIFLFFVMRMSNRTRKMIHQREEAEKKRLDDIAKETERMRVEKERLEKEEQEARRIAKEKVDAENARIERERFEEAVFEIRDILKSKK